MCRPFSSPLSKFQFRTFHNFYVRPQRQLFHPQFVELKGSVFKKFDKNNLFQVSCSDVRERLHLSVLLFIVVLQTMKEFSWREERFWILAPDCVLVLGFEVIIDWVKHAFITRQVYIVALKLERKVVFFYCMVMPLEDLKKFCHVKQFGFCWIPH